MVVKFPATEKMDEYNRGTFARRFDTYWAFPDYLDKFGYTERIGESLRILQKYFPFDTFVFDRPALDLVAGKNFMVQEYLPGE